MQPRSSNASKHESRNPIQRLVIARFHRRVVEVVQRLQPRTVLEVGCGEGYVLQALVRAGVRAELHGVDLDPTAVREARARLGRHASVEVADARRLAAQDGPLGSGGRQGPPRRFDLVLMLEVLEHLPDPAGMLPVLEALASPHVLLSVPHEPWFSGLNVLRGRHLRGLGNHPEHLQRFSRAAFVEFVASRFDIIAVPRCFPWTMVLGRRR
jgi:2-polyprenyl-3-methyl-5-hydroxy-6-metoxy-1,4-benzoquinol methylase